MPDPEQQPEQPPAGSRQDGRDRLQHALRPRISRSQAVVGVLLAIVGFLAIVQIRDEQSTGGEFAGARREDLLQLLDSLDAAAARARAEIEDLEARRRQLQSSAASREAAIAEARRQAEVLGLLAGTLPATGPGIVVRIEDPHHTIGTSTLLNAMEELRDAGAEAIEIDDSVRVVAQSAFVDVPGGVEVDGESIRPPYVVEVIGESHTLSEAMVFPGGLQDEVERLRGSVRISRSRDLEISALYSHPDPEFASPPADSGG
ncbi:MAG: DUF881 domain-containing protein [Nocardioidaceae bacterium]